MATTLRKLSKEEWEDVRGLATVVTNYDPATSSIKGQTTVQILQTAIGSLGANPIALGDAKAILSLLILREAYNTFVGVESKKRRKN